MFELMGRPYILQDNRSSYHRRNSYWGTWHHSSHYQHGCQPCSWGTSKSLWFHKELGLSKSCRGTALHIPRVTWGLALLTVLFYSVPGETTNIHVLGHGKTSTFCLSIEHVKKVHFPPHTKQTSFMTTLFLFVAYFLYFLILHFYHYGLINKFNSTATIIFRKPREFPLSNCSHTLPTCGEIKPLEPNVTYVLIFFR